MLRLSIFTFALLSSLPLFAQLKFEKTQILLDAPIGASEMKADFKFTNTGDGPISILSTNTKCDCTVANLEKKTYQVGESGVISATFTFGDREGEQKKTILVYTDKTGSIPYELDMIANIQPLLAVSPRMLFWKKGSETEAKSIVIYAHTSDELTLGQTPENLSYFNFKQTSVEGDNRTYEISPISMDEPVREDVKLTIFRKQEDGSQETVVQKRLFLMVR